MRLSVALPQVILGLPLKNAENPYLVSPSGRVRVEVSYSEGCSGLNASNVPHDIAGRLAGFWSKLSAGLGLKGCATISLLDEVGEGSSLYSALTVALLHAVARAHSDVMDEYEIVEFGRMSDPWEAPWWQGAVDAMRFCSATGKVVAYRNDEEAIELSQSEVRAVVQAVEAVGEGLDVGQLGDSVVNAIVHVIGQAVLEASDKVRQGSSPQGEVLRWARVQNGVAHIVYGVAAPSGSCIWAPGLPGLLEAVCIA